MGTSHPHLVRNLSRRGAANPGHILATGGVLIDHEVARLIGCRGFLDIIRQHRDEHAIGWLEGAIQMAIETGDPDLVLRRFLRLEA
jgi:hypothetical protein